MEYLLIGLIATPVAGVCRSAFRRHGFFGFIVAWLTFVGSFRLLTLVSEQWLVSGVLATVLAFLAVWGLSRAGMLPEA